MSNLKENKLSNETAKKTNSLYTQKVKDINSSIDKTNELNTVNEDSNDNLRNTTIASQNINVDKKKIEKPIKIFGIICLIISIITLVMFGTNTVDTSKAAQDALSEHVSSAISAGTVISNKDQGIEAKDYVIKHKSNDKTTKIWVWDYADEDGDYVQVIIDGKPLSDSFMIKNKPREFTIPSEGKVEIKGVKDGGGGISYAVRFEVNEKSYFNGAIDGKFNTYTLVR